MYDIKKILVPVDFSSWSKAALMHALALADRLGAQVTLYHVAEINPPAVAELTLSSRDGGTTVEQYAVDKATREMSEFVAGYAQGFPTPQLLVHTGKPRERILREAREGLYDLIVMGTHGRTGRAHSLAGSVTESLVRAAPCPVLSVRAES